MRYKIIATIFFIFLFITTAFAQDFFIKADVDKTKLTTDDILTYKIIVTSSEKKLPNPQIPKFEGFKVVSQAQSSTVSFAKSKIKTILVYAFILAPINIGKFKIEPSTIKIKDKTYSTDTFEIEVTQGKRKPLQKLSPESEEPKITL